MSKLGKYDKNVGDCVSLKIYICDLLGCTLRANASKIIVMGHDMVLYPYSSYKDCDGQMEIAKLAHMAR